MPKAVEAALMRQARKLAKQGKLRGQKKKGTKAAIGNFVYGTMTNMAKRGSIQWK